MGIKGSATCVLNLTKQLYMIGTKDKGLSAMFTMMNLERIVGIQGLGIFEIAYQNSLAYAKERKQGKQIIQNQYSRFYY